MITLKELEEFMRVLEDDKSKQTEWVVYTGQQGYDHFSLVMRGMYMPTGVPYKYVIFKRLPHIYYLSIGRKEGTLKVVIDTKKKEYRIYRGTKLIFSTLSDKELTRQVKKLYNGK